ncbi:hypothetical protein SDC9_134184 [bioreactor metagenome]|uniref:HTH gntR-type domain-containing protein n=1 Tax=bioreactor metagenome TaxID=1076179 RepID=A0A645DCN5_9ZZZZ
MKLDFENEIPIYLQIAQEIEDAVFTGSFPEETQIPSTTEISLAFQINPATVLKGMNLPVEEGLIYKKRGVGMFVCQGAREQIRQKRKETFFEGFVEKMVIEAKKLKLTKQELTALIERGFDR